MNNEQERGKSLTITVFSHEGDNRRKYTFHIPGNTISGDLIEDYIKRLFNPAFDGVYATKIVLPEGLMTIGEDTFKNYLNLTSVNVPETVTKIGKEAFFGSGIGEINIPDSVKDIGEGVFSYCNKMIKAHMPSGIETVKQETFKGCVNLERVENTQNIRNIQDFAFEGCEKLRDMAIPQAEFPANAFRGCPHFPVEKGLGRDLYRARIAAYRSMNEPEQERKPHKLVKVDRSKISTSLTDR